LYGGKGDQIIWRAGNNGTSGGYRREGPSVQNWKGNKIGLRRDTNIMEINKEKERDRTCYMCKK